jgi:RNA polymerase sigma-70 factor (ECF subfamily)
LVLIADQDRRLWNHDQIAEGETLVNRAMTTRDVGAYTVQAAIAAVHSAALTPDATDWAEIVRLYNILAKAEPSPVVALNRAVAIAMRDEPDAGLAIIDALLSEGMLADYRFAHSARADLLRRLGRTSEARAAYEQALALTEQEPERRFLERRLRELAN